MNSTLSVSERLEAFQKLGKKLATLSEQQIQEWCYKSQAKNAWFDEFHVRYAIEKIACMLQEKELEMWVRYYQIPERCDSKKVGVIMAGNIPAVGFHDFICVLMSGHQILAKLSSIDDFLLKAIAQELIFIQPKFERQIVWAEMLKEADAFIATGSDNSARYFEYYFRNKPHIIRKNRVSVAVLHGDETDATLELLTKDILLYYGLGCRNVAKIFVPQHFSIEKFLAIATPWSKECHQHYKYANNYDYNKSIYLVNQIPHLDNGSLIALETTELVSPISVVYYQKYQKIEEVFNQLAEFNHKIQCIASENGWFPNSIPIGQTQSPTLFDYPDNIDVMQFCLTLPS
ncbi:MAG: acyl-CoA reductase [Cytophagales bacterium]|nr:acyl-CoA reductase [Cytophagales bacterium]MDW8383273.1 acyl-CoA reductase [Flammeovirgaceae bacterium]